ncbi:MAG: SPFH domain-containing protein, partial [Nanoarchaeota archaeon]
LPFYKRPSRMKTNMIVTKETKNWGIDVVRTELKEIDPPQDVQDTMNKVVKAENEKIAALDFASATETRADGERRATIKQADGEKQSRILRAEGEAKAITTVAEATAQQIKLVNESLQKYFKNEAQDFKKLETAQIAFEQGTKYIIDSKSNITNVISDVAGIIPTKRR